VSDSKQKIPNNDAFFNFVRGSFGESGPLDDNSAHLFFIINHSMSLRESWNRSTVQLIADYFLDGISTDLYHQCTPWNSL